MQKELKEIILCPRCYSSVELKVDESMGEAVWNGLLTCNTCGSQYPVMEGIALLTFVDRSWEPIIREFLSRLELAEKVLFEGGLEKDRVSEADAHHEVTLGIMDQLFDDAVGDLRIEPGTRVLDVGAGFCKASRYFADRGAQVVALDTEFLHLRCVRFQDDMEVRLADDSPLKSYFEVFDNYFSRVMADSHRIPFEDGSFDVTLCRSTIHHLNDMTGALREMARVTKPGGLVLLTSEPIRSVLDREIDYLCTMMDYQEGFNERTVPIVCYTLPLRRYCKDIKVTYFRPGYMKRTERTLTLLHIDGQKHFTDGESVGFWRSAKLLFAGAGVNVKAFRSSNRARKPQSLNNRNIVCDIKELVTEPTSWDTARRISVCLAGKPPEPLELSQEKALRSNLLEQKERLRGVYRRFLDTGSFTTSVNIYSACKNVLRKGWREPQTAPGVTFRYSMKSATCYLRNDSSTQTISARMLGYPSEAGRASGSILINGVESCRYELTQFDSTVTMRKPAIDSEILEVEIKNDFTFIPDELFNNGDMRELGVAVVSISQ